MSPRGAFTRERLEGIGIRAVDVARRGLTDDEDAAFAHLSCAYPLYYYILSYPIKLKRNHII